MNTIVNSSFHYLISSIAEQDNYGVYSVFGRRVCVCWCRCTLFCFLRRLYRIILHSYNGRGLFFYLFLLAAGVCIFRSLSRNIDRRQEENRRLTAWIDRFRGHSETFTNRKEQWMEYKVFKCPSCGMKMRVPRGEGKIRVTCRQCGAVFEKKS